MELRRWGICFKGKNACRFDEGVGTVFPSIGISALHDISSSKAKVNENAERNFMFLFIVIYIVFAKLIFF